MKRLHLPLLFCLLSFTALAGNDTICKADTLMSLKDSSGIAACRITTLAITEGVVYGGILWIVLSDLHRNHNLQSRFHFNSHRDTWKMGMDKTHHATAAYNFSRMEFLLLQWAGLGERRATWLGGLSGLFWVTTKEVFDGFKTDWGASIGDMAANTMGSALFISQQLAWHEQKILLKWSYHPTSFPDYRPDVLGSNFIEKMFKDYNGQTFWLSANLHAFAGRDSRIPRWLNIALGFGATGMTGPAITTPYESSHPIPGFENRHLFYIAPDVDLTRIPTRSATLKWIFEAIGFLKFPLPALEISGQGVKFKPVCF